MIKHIILVMFLFPSLAFTQSQSLCGGADQIICMTNTRVYQEDCTSSYWQPGSIILIKVPGMNNEDPYSANGEPTAPYWFSENNGSVTDTSGGVWSQAYPIFTDDNGDLVIGFQLESGLLTGIVNIQLNNIGVCQKVSDGPRSVYLTVQFWANLSQKTMPMLKTKTMDNFSFSECDEWQGYAPLVEGGDLLYLVNPHQEDILVNISGTSYTFAPNQQMVIPGGDLIQINSSMKLGIVLRSHDNDLNLVTINSRDAGAYILPHISNHPDSWKNEWKFAAGKSMDIQSQVFGSDVETDSFDSGLWSHEFVTTTGQADTWVRLNSSQPTNGYFEFNRIDGIAGGASLNGLRPVAKPFGSNTLILSHVASDIEHFWTGYALVNPNEDAAAVTMTGYQSDGTVFGLHQLTLNPGQKMVEVIGQNVFSDFQGLSWVKIESDVPLAGVELFGGQNSNQPYLSGFLLSDMTADALSFPLIDTTPGWWSGLSLLNPGTSDISGTLKFFDASGSTFLTIPVALAAGEKQLILAPELATQASWDGGPCLGFALIGDDERQYLGGYLAIPIQ